MYKQKLKYMKELIYSSLEDFSIQFYNTSVIFFILNKNILDINLFILKLQRDINKQIFVWHSRAYI